MDGIIMGAVQNANLVCEVGRAAVHIEAFFKENPVADLRCERITLTIENAFKRLVDVTMESLAKAKCIAVTPTDYVMVGIVTGPAAVEIEAGQRIGDDDDEHPKVSTIHLTFYGSPKDLTIFNDFLEDTFGSENQPMAKWWYRSAHGPETKDIFLQSDVKTLAPELYPDLGDPEAYLDRYMKSDAAILLMAGAPGTGKTTLLRHLICSRRLNSHIIYDEELMKSDSVFQAFLFNNNSDIMVIEDADTILMPRETDGNKMMSRFLNVADGLIRLPNKKLVFTTNITDFGKVDPALLRPGRCFGVLHTRPLTLPEAQAAAKVCNLTVPTARKDYTLAELFNPNEGGGEQRRLGFVA